MDQKNRAGAVSAASSQPGAVPESAPPTYLSFVLRCQATKDGRVLVRLSDVRSGRSLFVTDLDDLPDLVRRRLQA